MNPNTRGPLPGISTALIDSVMTLHDFIKIDIIGYWWYNKAVGTIKFEPNMNYPKTTFLEANQENLANYLCYLAKQISCGFYQDRRFLVLPYLIPKDSRVIYFPDLPYTTKFWNNFASLKQNVFVFDFDKKVVDLAKELLASQEELLRSKNSSLEMTWRKIEPEFWKTVADFLPQLSINKINKIEILPTPFGSVGSFFFKRVGSKFYFKITVRTDFGPAQIAETILTNLIWIDHPTPNLALWHQVEATVDFLLTKSKIGKLFDFDYVPTVTQLPEIPTNLAAESEQYLGKLGFPITSVLGYDNQHLIINNHVVYNHFTPSEKRILSNLITHKNEVIAYDQIGNWFWGDSEDALDKFNLYSVAKIMEKIRKKIKDQGVYQELIYTIRGQGYVLYD